jgi:hypothetical protein
MLMIARLLIDDDGELSYADCDSFLKPNRVLYVCLNRARLKPAVLSDIATEGLLTQLLSTVSVRRRGLNSPAARQAFGAPQNGPGRAADLESLIGSGRGFKSLGI